MKNRVENIIYTVIVWIFIAFMIVFFFVAAMMAPIWNAAGYLIKRIRGER